MRKYLLNNRDIICFAGEDWWYHNPHSNLHIMKCFASSNRILFVNSIGMRIPNVMKGASSYKRIFRKMKSLVIFIRKAESNIYVLTPFAIPYFKGNIGKFVGFINKVLLILQVESIRMILRFKDPIVWVSMPTFKDIALYLRKRCSRMLIYYCVDNISYYDISNQKQLEIIDIELQRKADLSFFVNHKLVTEREKYNKETYFLSHGVDFEHFSKSQKGTLPVPTEIANLNRPIVGFVGVVADLDEDLINFLATNNKNYSFVFVGHKGQNFPKLDKLENIIFLGKKAYELLPNYIQEFSCCCLFYDMTSTFNIYRNPKKLLEYLATGKPVVSVPILEIEYFKDVVSIAKTYEEFNDLLKIAINKDNEDKKMIRMEKASANTWEHITEDISRRISNLNVL